MDDDLRESCFIAPHFAHICYKLRGFLSRVLIINR